MFIILCLNIRFLSQYICYSKLTVACQQQRMWYNKGRNMKKITDYLQKLGLTEVQAILYQGLLEIGPTTVMELAEHVDIKRITAHFNIKNLIEKGLVTQTIRGARRQIMAEPPERLEYFVKQKLDAVNNLQGRFPDFLDIIHTSFPKVQTRKNVEIKYYEGKQAVMHIYKEALKAKEFRAYVTNKELLKVFPINHDLFAETFKKRKEMQIWEIMDDSPEARLYINKMPQENRFHYKFIPKDVNLSIIDYMIFDGKVAIVNFEKKVTGILIINERYYNNAKALYGFVWQMLR